MPSGTTSGNFLIATVLVDSASTVTAPTCAGCTWTTGKASTTGNSRIGIFYSENIPGSVTTMTMHLSTGSSKSAAVVSEFSGVAASSSIDIAGNITNAFGGTGGGLTTASITTTNANDLLVASAGYTWDSAVSSGPTNTFTTTRNVNDTTTRRSSLQAYHVVAATGSYTTNWVLAADNDIVDAMLSFKAAGGGGGAAPVKHRVIN